MPHAQSTWFHLVSLEKKNYSSQTQLMYNSVPVSNESFVQGGKG